MPTASMKAETNGITDSNDPLDRIQNEIASRLSELALKKEELDNDSAHPRARFYKNLSKDVIQYKKLSPDQLNHLREMDATYSTLDAVKEISEIVNECLNEHRTRFKKQQKKASQDKAREIFERVKEVLKIQSSLELAVTHPQLFLEPLSQEHPATSTELLEKLQRIHGLITPPRVTDCTKSIAEAVHSAAQHIHLLVDGRNKFVTKGTTYEDVKAQFIDRASVCSYYIEKVVEPEPEETDQGVEEEVQQLAPELEAAQLNQVQDKSEGEVGCPSEEADVEEDIAVNEATQAMNHAAELPSAAIVPLEKTEDHLAISSAGPVPLDASAAVYMIRDPTQHPPPPPGLQPHPQQAAAPLLMGQGLPQQQAMQSQEAFAAALTQQQQQQHMHVMYQLEQQQQLEHQQHLEQQQQQHLLQQREQQQQQQQQQLEEEHDDGSSIHNDSIKDLLTLSDFNFLQESVIDKPTAATGSPAPSVSEAAVYMDPAIVSVVSIGSVNPAESVIVPASEPLVAPVDHFIAAAAAAAAAPPPQAPQPQLSLAGPPPPVVTSQKLSHASNNLATIPTPNFPPTVPPPTTSLANVPPPPVHASNARPPPSSHPLEPEQFFSHAPPPPPHTASYQADNLNYSAPPPPPTAAAPAPQTSLTPTLDNTPNPPPPIPLPQEHTSSSWDQPSQNWVDDQPQMNGGGQTSPSNGAEVQQSASSDWSAAPVEEKSRHSNRSWGSEEGDNIAGNWGSDVRSPPRGPQMSQQDDYDRKMGGVNNSYRNGPHHRMRRDGGELEDYGGHDDGGYWGDEDYDDRRGGMYARGRGGRGRINNNHNGGGGYRGRGGYNGNGYQNGRGGYGPQGGFRSRGGMGGPTGGGFRGMRGANRGGSGMPRGGGGNAGGAYRSSRGNYPVQRPYYGQ